MHCTGTYTVYVQRGLSKLLPLLDEGDAAQERLMMFPKMSLRGRGNGRRRGTSLKNLPVRFRNKFLELEQVIKEPKLFDELQCRDVLISSPF